jgi:hypothetical protein
MQAPASSTVRTETAEYRGYELHATEWLGRWEVSISPAIENLPWPRPEDVPAAPTLEEALAKARWRVDRLVKASRGSASRY